MVNCEAVKPKTFVYERKTQKSLISFMYTPNGLARLALLIQASLAYRGWSIRKLAREAKQKGHSIAPSTIIRYINSECDPLDEKIRAIAPFIYQAIRFVDNEVEIDTTQTYEDWQELAIVGTNKYDIHAVNTNSKLMNENKLLAEMIQTAMSIYGITQTRLEKALQVMQEQNITDMSLDRLREIQSGSDAVTREERRTLYMLLDSEGKAFSDTEWFGDAEQTKNPAIQELREGENHTNNH